MGERRRVLVIGGGASGLMAAATAAQKGHAVTLLEQNTQFGKKLLITGNGRCNLTHDCSPEEVERQVATNSRFLRHALHSCSPSQVIRFFESIGLPCLTQDDGRVFPRSQKARDVVDALVAKCVALKVELKTGIDVRSILIDQGHIKGVATSQGSLDADAVVLATGGVSYPGTGSNGSGFAMARELGHTVTPLLPSLVPIETEENWPSELQGISLQGVRLAVQSPAKRKLFSSVGDLIFTHYGLSGPLTLLASRHAIDEPKSQLIITLKPELTDEAFDLLLLDMLKRNSRCYISNCLSEVAPKSMVPLLLKLSNVPPETLGHKITKDQRSRIQICLRRLQLTVKTPRDISEAVITRGGVLTSEISPKTMESKLVPGLYLAGEVLDVDAYTGGYNLHIAWATGYLAGISII